MHSYRAGLSALLNFLVRFDTIPECVGRTDRHICSSNISASIACYVTALVKKCKCHVSKHAPRPNLLPEC